MVGGNALVKAITVIGVVLLRLGFTVELSIATRHFAAVSDRRPVTPVEAFAHSEIWVKDVIHAELNGSGVQDPGLISRRVAGDVEGIPGSVRMDHKGCDLRRHGAPQWITRWNDVARVRIANRNSAYEARRRRAKNLSRKHGSSQRIRGDLSSRQQRTEVACLEGVDGCGIAEAG